MDTKTVDQHANNSHQTVDVPAQHSHQTIREDNKCGMLILVWYMITMLIIYIEPVTVLRYEHKCNQHMSLSDIHQEETNALFIPVIFALVEHVISIPFIVIAQFCLKKKKMIGILVILCEIVISLLTVVTNSDALRYLNTRENCAQSISVPSACSKYVPDNVIRDRYVNPCQFHSITIGTLVCCSVWLLVSFIISYNFMHMLYSENNIQEQNISEINENKNEIELPKTTQSVYVQLDQNETPCMPETMDESELEKYL